MRRVIAWISAGWLALASLECPSVAPMPLYLLYVMAFARKKISAAANAHLPAYVTQRAKWLVSAMTELERRSSFQPITTDCRRASCAFRLPAAGTLYTTNLVICSLNYSIICCNICRFKVHFLPVVSCILWTFYRTDFIFWLFCIFTTVMASTK